MKLKDLNKILQNINEKINKDMEKSERNLFDSNQSIIIEDFNNFEEWKIDQRKKKKFLKKNAKNERYEVKIKNYKNIIQRLSIFQSLILKFLLQFILSFSTKKKK